MSDRDPHPRCIMCMCLKHAQTLLADPQTCHHFASLPMKILKMRVAEANKQDPCLSRAATQSVATNHLILASTSWVDIMEDDLPSMLPLVEGLLMQKEGDQGDKDAALYFYLLSDFAAE